MKPFVIVAGVLLLGTLRPDNADAWASANRYGGSTSHSYGETSHTNAYGGSTGHAYGQGTEHTNTYGGSSEHGWGGGSEHTNAYGGSTSGAYGQGATHTNVYGGSTSGAYGQGATHTYASGATAYVPPAYHGYAGYPAYHPPVAVPYYSASGCYGCAAAAGLSSARPLGSLRAPPPRLRLPPHRPWRCMRRHPRRWRTRRCRLAASTDCFRTNTTAGGRGLRPLMAQMVFTTASFLRRKNMEWAVWRRSPF